MISQTPPTSLANWTGPKDSAESFGMFFVKFFSIRFFCLNIDFTDTMNIFATQRAPPHMPSPPENHPRGPNDSGMFFFIIFFIRFFVFKYWSYRCDEHFRNPMNTSPHPQLTRKSSHKSQWLIISRLVRVFIFFSFIFYLNIDLTDVTNISATQRTPPHTSISLVTHLTGPNDSSWVVGRSFFIFFSLVLCLNIGLTDVTNVSTT